jgi:pyruvate/2-oxoglutarate/acetoin dehydrogenase E1 component
MRKGTLTREQAIQTVGADAVEAVESENFDYTNRVQTDGDDSVEFAAGVRATTIDGDDVTLLAYYYQDQDTLDAAEQLDELDWEIEGYEVIY